MDSSPRAPTLAAVVIVLLLALGAGYYLTRGGAGAPSPTSTSTPTATSTEPGSASGLIELALGQTGSVLGVKITPREVVEDSRCPSSVQCIQAGTVRVRATLVSGLGTSTPAFLLGEPVTTEAEAVTLVEVKPAKIMPGTTPAAEYRFVFKVTGQAVTYRNASANMIKVETPTPGAVTGKQFTVQGQARGNWYFEASFPIDVLDKNGKKLTTVVAQAGSDWMTTSFVPFSVLVTVPQSYIGPATIVLNKDNPSGLPANDASLSFPITIEY